MKAFHHSGTNLISVWKSGPRTAVLSEKSQMFCEMLYLQFQLRFHIIAQTFFDLITFFPPTHILYLCFRLHFTTYQ